MSRHVEPYLVAKAMNVFAAFCEKHGIKLTPGNIAEIAIALHNCEFSEFSPSVSEIDRIVTTSQTNEDSPIFIVFADGNELLEKLTNGLNTSIRAATLGKWVTTK